MSVEDLAVILKQEQEARIALENANKAKEAFIQSSEAKITEKTKEVAESEDNVKHIGEEVAKVNDEIEKMTFRKAETNNAVAFLNGIREQVLVYSNKANTTFRTKANANKNDALETIVGNLVTVLNAIKSSSYCLNTLSENITDKISSAQKNREILVSQEKDAHAMSEKLKSELSKLNEDKKQWMALLSSTINDSDDSENSENSENNEDSENSENNEDSENNDDNDDSENNEDSENNDDYL